MIPTHKDDFYALESPGGLIKLKKVMSQELDSNLIESTESTPKTTSIFEIENSTDTLTDTLANRESTIGKSKFMGISRVSCPRKDIRTVFKNCGHCKELPDKKYRSCISLQSLPRQLFGSEDIYHYVIYLSGFKESLARYFFKQLVKAVLQCYSKGMDHKPISLEDLYLDEEFRIILNDFGIKKNKLHRKVTKFVMTKKDLFCHACYIGPEVLRNEKDIDPKAADVFSLGVCLFVMCCAHTPFREATKTDPLYLQLIEKDPEKFWKFYEFQMRKEETFSSDLKDLITRMIAYDPKKRIKLEDITTHPWYKGLCKPNHEVVNSLENVRKQLHIKDAIENLEKKDEEIIQIKKIGTHVLEPIEESSPSLGNPDIDV